MISFEEFCEKIEEEKELMTKTAWYVLYLSLEGKQMTSHRFNAAKEVLDRLEGKAKQPIEVNQINELNEEQLNNRINEIEKRIAEIKAREIKVEAD